MLPAYNEVDSMDLLHGNMLQVADENRGYEWEFLLVNDGSTDGTLDRIKAMHEADKRFSYIDLSRNFGKELAMMSGFDYATGDAVIIMDADMQHPISLIPEMLRHWEEGYQDVYARRKSSKESWMKRNTSHIYYKILKHIAQIPVQEDTGDFRLLDRACVMALRQMPETQRNTKGMYSWIGFRKYGLEYDQLEREHGTSKWSYWQLLSLAVKGITSYTTAPLRISSLLGVVFSLVGFCYLIYIVFSTLFFGEVVRGYPTLMVTILFLGGIQLLSLGIIGEYLSCIFNESKHRPGYIVNTYNGKQQYGNGREKSTDGGGDK